MRVGNSKTRVGGDKMRVDASKTRVCNDKMRVDGSKMRVCNDKMRVDSSKTRVDNDKMRVGGSKTRVPKLEIGALKINPKKSKDYYISGMVMKEEITKIVEEVYTSAKKK